MNDGSESNTHLDVSNHVILVLDILGYSDLILNSDETRMLQQFDSMVTSIRENIAKMSGVNSRIQWKMYSDNFLIYASSPNDAIFPLRAINFSQISTAKCLRFRHSVTFKLRSLRFSLLSFNLPVTPSVSTESRAPQSRFCVVMPTFCRG